jgi:putative flippase GtrA
MESRSTSKPDPLSSFVRFVVCGGGVGLLAGLAVPLVATVMPWALANAVITVASTLLCTELHALFTFGTGRRPGLRRHLQSAGSATAAYVVTCAATALLHVVQSSPTLLTEQAVYLGASALAGTGRFLVLRLVVFSAEAGDRGGAGVREGAGDAGDRRPPVPGGPGLATGTGRIAPAASRPVRHSPAHHLPAPAAA